MNSLPNGWSIAHLTELADLNPPNPSMTVPDQTLVSFVPMAAVEAITGRMTTAQTRAWKEVKKGFTRFQEGDVVLAKITPSMENGKVARAVNLTNGIGAGTTEFHVLRPHADIDNRYLLYYFLQESFRRRARSHMTGTAGQLRVPSAFLEKETLSVAPPSEQVRIAEGIETYLSRLDAALASLQRAQTRLKAYRAAVLKAAVEGCLVPIEAELARAENREYEPADVLLERILAERRRRWEETELAKLIAAGRTPKDDQWKNRYKSPEGLSESRLQALPGLPKGWVWTRISVVGNVQLGRQRSPIHHRGDHMRPYLRVANVFEDRIDTSDVMEMNFTPGEFETYRLEIGDILLNEGQSPHLLGRPALYRGEVPGSCFQNTLIRFRASSGVDPRFALIVFRSQLHSRRYMQESQITTNIAHLSVGRFAEIEFPLAPKDEQIRIADEVDRLMSVANSVESLLKTQLVRIGRIRQSILKWAFEGKLVDQDPNDEPAERLLERIRTARIAPAHEKKTKAKTAS
jgi:type I restriction enzyme S subunit